MKEKMRSLHIDLNEMTTQYQDVPESILKLYLGGRGLNAWWAQKLIKNKMDALSAENPLLISAGALTGTVALSSSRVQMTAISPLTSLLANSNVGGFWGVELIKKGIISLVITGRAETPVYISITDTGVVIRSAEEYWGMDTRQAADQIRQALHDEKGYIAVIGPAGERQVRSAAVLFGEGDAAGRTGLGAVLGSKNLKAIAVSISKKPVRASPKQMELAAEHARLVTEHESFQEWHTFGDSGQVKWLDDFNAGPAYNYRQPQYEQVDSANGYRLAEAPTRYRTCYRCPVRCKAAITIPSGADQGFTGERPPFEPMAAWGAKCGNPNVYTSVFLHTLCNRWGMDSIETASLVAFAIDLSQRGILPPEKTGGEILEWGHVGQMKRLTEEIAFRSTWLGKTLGEGLAAAAAAIGPEANAYAYHVKGMAMTSMDPRGFKGTGLGYCISSRGADFSNPYPSLECGYNPRRSMEIFGDEGIGDRLKEDGKGRMVRYTASVSAVLDSLGLCKIPYLSILNDFTLVHPTALVNSAYDWEMDREKMIACGERVVTLERLVNIRLGLEPAMDRLPEKFRTEPMPAGICAGETVDDARMVMDFYREMGWDQNGEPTEETLEKLKIDL